MVRFLSGIHRSSGTKYIESSSRQGRKGVEQLRMQTENEKEHARVQAFLFDENRVSKTRAIAPLRRHSQFFAQKGPRVGVSIMYGMYNSNEKRYKGCWFCGLEVRT